jgi:hypothetical protein
MSGELDEKVKVSMLGANKWRRAMDNDGRSDCSACCTGAVRGKQLLEQLRGKRNTFLPRQDTSLHWLLV